MPFGENTIGTLYTTIDGKMVELGKATLTEVETYLEESKYEWIRVVRCKDCAKREYCRTSTIWAVAPDDNWYCADAERRTDGSD